MIRLSARRTTRRAAAAACLAAALACAAAPEERPAASGGEATAPEATAPAAPSAAESEPEAGVGLPGPAEEEALPVVVFLGDSLTAGYGLAEEQAWPAVLEERFAREGLPFRAVNAGVSGDTSAGGLRRLDWALRTRPDVIVVELGANEGLRGLELGPVEANLRQVVARSRDAGARVLLVGLRIPPNYGPDYTRRFAEIFPRVAGELGVPLVPFLLDGVGGESSLNLGDGVHPNVEGHRRVADVVAPHLRPLVEAAVGHEAAAAGV